jgi:GNAT superfamily N-acetyltransferase
MDAVIRELEHPETALAYAAVAELRPHVSSTADFCDRVERQRAEGYRLVAAFEAGEEDAVAAAGFRVVHNLASGRFLYVDDLVTRSAHRRQGHGARLLAWLREEAARQGCEQVQLDSGHQRFDAHRRYLAAGFDITAHHFAIRSL